MSSAQGSPDALLWRGLAGGRIHSAYLLSGAGDAPVAAARRFARGLVCDHDGEERPCDRCRGCLRSGSGEEPDLDGTGKRGPLLRHVGEHPDLLWVERGADDTRVRIGQVRALQQALRLRSSEGGWRAAVIAGAEWLNQEAQNALLRLLEEPPDRTALILVASTASGLLATLRSRCQRVNFPREAARLANASDEIRALAERISESPQIAMPALLDWAAEYRGARAPAAAAVNELLETASLWLRERVGDRVAAGEDAVRAELAAFRRLQACRKSLAQRNANPQMVAERALLALREVGA